MKKIEKVGVLGSGTMGIDIAILCAEHGFDVIIWHRTSADIAKHRLAERIKYLVEKNIYDASTATNILDEIVTTSSDEWAASVDVIIESIVEIFDAKIEILLRFERIMKAECILVSNTSSLSIIELGLKLEKGKSFAGMHFFNPATKMELVEIITSKKTSEETVDRLRTLAEKLGKKAVRVKDIPGFIVNRLLMVQINTAFTMLESGAATAEDIDCAITAGLGYKKGPLSLADYIGLDVVLNILRSIYSTTNEVAYRPTRMLEDLVEDKRYGRKSGVGVYTYLRDRKCNE